MCSTKKFRLFLVALLAVGVAATQAQDKIYLKVIYRDFNGYNPTKSAGQAQGHPDFEVFDAKYGDATTDAVRCGSLYQPAFTSGQPAFNNAYWTNSGDYYNWFKTNYMDAGIGTYSGWVTAQSRDVYPTLGMVANTLTKAVSAEKYWADDLITRDGNEIPVYKPSKARDACNNSMFDQWFADVPGVNYRVEDELELLRIPGTNKYTLDYSHWHQPSTTPGTRGNKVTVDGLGNDFLPLDKYGNANPGGGELYGCQQTISYGVNGSEQAMPRTKSCVTSGQGYRNFGYTMESHLMFSYYGTGDEHFEFQGDDDLWIFIDGELAADVGGTHMPIKANLNIQDYASAHGWARNTQHRMDIFYAERQSNGSNLKLTVSLNDLKVSEKHGPQVTGARVSDGNDPVVWVYLNTRLHRNVINNINNGVFRDAFLIKRAGTEQAFNVTNIVEEATVGAEKRKGYKYKLTFVTGEGSIWPNSADSISVNPNAHGGDPLDMAGDGVQLGVDVWMYGANMKVSDQTIYKKFDLVSAQSRYITMPSTWPNNQMALGYTWGAQADGIPSTTNGTIGLNQIPYRHITAQMGAGCSDLSCASLAVPIAAYEELGNSLPNLVGTDGHESERLVNLGAVVSILGIGVEDVEVDVRNVKDALLNRMTNVSTLVNWFNSLNKIAGALTKSAHPVLILEPNLWSTILQARFHFRSEKCNKAECQDKRWAKVLEFSVPLRQALQSANSPILSEVNANPDLYPENVAGLARAMVRAVRYAIPTATVFAHASTWAVYANGCAGLATTENLTNENLREFKSTKSMVNWQAEDIEISAMANVRFYRELFGWNDDTRSRLNDNVWPHGFAIEKYGYDAGMVQYSNHYTAQSSFPMPGAGTGTFFWDQHKMDNWLRWAGTLSQGSGLPLIAYGIPIGNGSMPNQPFQWQDTFVDWLFSSSNWGGQFTWNADNWDRFKQAGFLGVLAARNGWPATGTNWGTLSNTGVATGCNSTIRGQVISCPASSAGDGMFFFNQFVAHDRTLSDIPITFDEEDFAHFSGFCRGRFNGVTTRDKKNDYIGTGTAFIRDGRVFLPVNGHNIVAKVYDLFGRERLDIGNSLDDGMLSFETAALPAGTYFISATIGDDRSVQAIHLK